LSKNPIPKNILLRLGAEYDGDYPEIFRIIDPQKFVEYSRPIQDRLEKIKKLMKVSTRFKLDMLREILNMDSHTFNYKIIDWAEEFGFTIDGDYLIIKKDMVSDFLDALEKQFVS